MRNFNFGKVKPTLKLDKVPLSYKRGKSYLTGKIALADVSVCNREYTKEHIEYAKKYWANKREEV
jgi:hypothetical protein